MIDIGSCDIVLYATNRFVHPALECDIRGVHGERKERKG